MRMMLKAKLDTQMASQRVQDGSLSEVMQRTLEMLKPEAAYFGPEGGVRTAFLIFDLADPSQLPAISEPLYSQLGAKLEMFPVMDQDDLRKGLAQLAE